MTMMNAAVVTEPGKIEVRELPEPAVGPYEARCRMLFGTVCPGTDTHLLHDDPPFCDWVTYPLILGHESTGEVTDVGEKVRHLKPGDRVTRVGATATGGVSSGWGGFATVGVALDHRAMKEDGVDPAEWQEHTRQVVLPGDVAPEAACLFVTWRETLSYLTRLGVAGRSVLVVGSGVNGLSLATHAQHLGATSVAMIGNPARADLAAKLGADTFHDYRAAPPTAPADVVLDVIGTQATADLAASLVAPGGTIGRYGLDAAGVTIPAGDHAEYTDGYDEAEAHDDVLRLHRAGTLDAADWIDVGSPYPLTRIADALADVAARKVLKPLIDLRV